MKEFLIKIRALFEGSAALKQVEQGLDQAKQKAHELTDALKLGAAIDVGGKIVEGLRRIPEILKEAVNQGMEFNRMMQNSQIGIAGGFRSVDPGLSFEEAKAKGGEALDLLKQKALDLGLNFEALIDTFKVNVPIMWEAGIKDTQKMIDLITLLNQVAAAKGIDGFQAQRDIIDIMNGMGQRTILGKELEANGVSNESIKAAKEQGTLYDLLTTKLSAYGEAGKAASETQTAALNRLHTAWTALMGEVSKPWFDEVTKGINEINGSLDSERVKSWGETFGSTIRGVIEELKNLTVAAGTLPSVKGPAGQLLDGFNADVGAVLAPFADLVRYVSRSTELWSVKGATAASEDSEEKMLPRLFQAQDKNLAWKTKKGRDERWERDNNWSVPLDAAHAAQLARQKSTADAEAQAEGDRKLKDLPSLVRAGSLQRQISDTRAYANDGNQSDENRAAGVKKLLELEKELHAVEKQISDDARKTAEKREELELELRIKEAKASGNDDLKDKLTWQRDYNRLLQEARDSGMSDPEGYARRSANASVDQSTLGKAIDVDATARRAFPVSDTAKMGMAMGESTSAAMHADTLRQILMRTVTKDDIKAIVTGQTFRVEEQNGGYQ